MAMTRDILGSIDTNRLPIDTHNFASSSSTTTPSLGSSRKAIKLAPIFLQRGSRTPRSHRIPPLYCSPTTAEDCLRTDLLSSSPTPHTRKRVRLDLLADKDDHGEDCDKLEPMKCGQRSSINDFFYPTASSTPDRTRSWKQIESEAEKPLPVAPTPNSWRRTRSRLGNNGISARLLTVSSPLTYHNRPSILSTLQTSTDAFDPLVDPSIIFLPSHHSPTGYARDFSPPLSVAFNSVAKHYDAASAKEIGKQRMLAIGGEEGGLRIINVDEGLGQHREEKGLWWRAHPNAVFDIKWSGDDSRILTASGDQTTRIHTLENGSPQVTATMRGHTSSVKTTVFFDPTRSHLDPSTTSSVVASAGRDGNILIFDLRCQGRISDSPCGMSRPNYSNGVDGFCAQQDTQILDPVMTIRGAHGDGMRKSSPNSHRTALRSVTSLVALQSMPGMLASGGSYDGIVKLWDLRFPATERKTPRPSAAAWGELPDPTILCANPSRRSRSVNALVESPTTGDLYSMCGDSKIHALRPAYARAPDDEPDVRAILPKTYTDPGMRVSTFYLRASISPDGKNLACGSSNGGIMSWDIDAKADAKGEVRATRLGYGKRDDFDVSAIDWGHDMLAACVGDATTRIWRSKP